jgi:sugar-phosphatase
MEYEALLFDLYGTLIDERSQAVPGAVDLLTALAPERWAIVTSCYGSLARELLARAALPIPGVLVTSDQVEANKPSPEGYRLAARRLGYVPQACLVFEDSAHGVAAAVAAGMDVVAVCAIRDPKLARWATALVARLTDARITTTPEGRYSLSVRPLTA